MTFGVALLALVLWELQSMAAQRPTARYPVRLFRLTRTSLPPPHGEITEGTVVVDGVRIHYASGGTGPPVVFCHGLAGNSGHWFRNLEPLTGVAQVYALDWPGFGLSDKPAATRLDTAFQVRMLEGFLDALGLEQVTLVGHSLGGHWTSAFLLAHPDRAQAYIAAGSAAMMLSIPAYRRPLRVRAVRQAYTRLAASRRPPDGGRLFWESALLFSQPVTPEFLRRVSNFDTLGDPASVPFTVAAYGSPLRTPLRAQVHRITTPTLLVWGAQDRTTPIEDGLLLARTMPRAQLFVMSAAGHMPFLQEPDRFNRAVAQFLETTVGHTVAATGADGAVAGD